MRKAQKLTKLENQLKEKAVPKPQTLVGVHATFTEDYAKGAVFHGFWTSEEKHKRQYAEQTESFTQAKFK